MPVETRPSFTKERMADNVGIPKNTFGHTLWGDGSKPTSTQIAEEDLHIVVDERGERRVTVDLFDSPVMKDYIAKQRSAGAIVQEDDGSMSLHAVPQPPVQETLPELPPRRTLGDPQSLEDFDRYMQAFNRGDDLSNVIADEDDEEDYSPVVLSHAPKERSPLDGPCGLPTTPVEQNLIPAAPTRTATVQLSGTNAVRVAQQERVATQPSAPTAAPPRKAPPIPLTPAIPCDKNCGAALPTVAKFCWWCGHAQQAKFCVGCGYNFQRNEKFCPDCGSAR